MKHVPSVLVVILVACLLLLCFVGCRSPEAQSAWDEVEAYRVQIEADGVVTPEEAEQYVEKVQSALELERDELAAVDWGALAGTAISSVIASFLGINVFRNQREVKKWGTPEAPK